MPPLKAIRLHCLECCGSSNEVKNCQIDKCNLYEYRFGKNPNRVPRVLTDEQRAAMAERFAKVRKNK